MAKIYGMFGVMTGKVADVVMSVRGGVQIARRYQPIVANPSTSAQVAQRAKLKLMSQLAAVVSPVIAMKRVANLSSRNLFIKKNYRLTDYTNDQATINLPDVQLTVSSVGLPAVVVSQDEVVKLSLAASMQGLLDRVVYVVVARQSDGKLRLVNSYVVNTPGASGTFDVDTTYSTIDGVVYAYGVRDNSEVARAIFGELTAPTAETIAKLLVQRNLIESDVTLTETRGINVVPSA